MDAIRDTAKTGAYDSSYFALIVASSALVYLMGPYKSYPPYDPPPPEVEGVATTRPTLDDIDEHLGTGDVELDLDLTGIDPMKA